MKQLKLTLPGDNDYFVEEAYKVLRTNLQFCGQDKKVICLTSCNENEGKSTVSLHISKSFAELGKKVLMIDADMRKSVIAGRNTDAQNPTGLCEILTGLNTLEDCLYEVEGLPNMNVIFAGQYPPNPVELLSGKYFESLIKEQRENYDYIVIDTPPLGQVIDTAVIAENCDGAVLLIGTKVRYRHAQEVVAQLNKSGCKILGAIRNHARRGGTKYSKYKYSKYKYGSK